MKHARLKYLVGNSPESGWKLGRVWTPRVRGKEVTRGEGHMIYLCAKMAGGQRPIGNLKALINMTSCNIKFSEPVRAGKAAGLPSPVVVFVW
ncbi:unnamed protein product [Sordaria macrospora k-hell]|uniref:WGS project CABT00000000 data, contig 2.49 n=1 Tax=Sordaria macrospora (strain ATCC MYA-333 / DSM 997 / K(L3346) / K-hell) TaxID=771870 RepID=F7W961_SORMK|nr:uncharacterized protein SMAC_12789 [Sordaria macrospora k-hell]KAH7629371.1 hypothetical protein B0T09DRAFT_266180 [Sordaria sp. MPI-SDFR-AT-0083]CCC05141.1 unnamed protein product [Sordaria macrospora k-hell]